MTKLKIIFTDKSYAIIEYDKETKRLIVGSQDGMVNKTIKEIRKLGEK